MILENYGWTWYPKRQLTRLQRFWGSALRNTVIIIGGTALLIVGLMLLYSATLLPTGLVKPSTPSQD